MYEIILNILDNFNFENCGRILNATLPYFSWQLAFYRHLPTSGRQNKVKKILPPFQRYSESWVQKDSVSTCLKKISVENFWVWSDLRKISVFNEFAKKIRWPAADSILMPPTFPIANLNRYTPQFSGEPHKLTWCQQFGLQIFPKWGGADFLLQKNAVFLGFFLD